MDVSLQIIRFGKRCWIKVNSNTLPLFPKRIPWRRTSNTHWQHNLYSVSERRDFTKHAFLKKTQTKLPTIGECLHLNEWKIRNEKNWAMIELIPRGNVIQNAWPKCGTHMITLYNSWRIRCVREERKYLHLHLKFTKVKPNCDPVCDIPAKVARAN